MSAALGITNEGVGTNADAGPADRHRAPGPRGNTGGGLTFEVSPLATPVSPKIKKLSAEINASERDTTISRVRTNNCSPYM
jgi:hypothetical protein